MKQESVIRLQCENCGCIIPVFGDGKLPLTCVCQSTLGIIEKEKREVGDDGVENL